MAKPLRITLAMLFLVGLVVGGLAWHRHSLKNQEILALTGRVLMVGLNGENYQSILAAARSGHLGGVIVFASAFKSKEDLRDKILSIRKVAPWPLIFAMDMEGGKTDRFSNIGLATTPTAWELGSAGDEATSKMAHEIAENLKSVGIDLNLAPVVDLRIDPISPAIALLQRSYSVDPAVVVARAQRFIQAHRELGIGTTLKHFPGHGSAHADSHLKWTDVTFTWSENELVPYRQLLNAEFSGAVMTGHLFNRLWDTELPASLSPLVVEGMLRRDLKFDGVVITDDLQMQSVARRFSRPELMRLALLAGNDVLLFSEQFHPDDLSKLHAEIAELVRSGKIPLVRIQQANRRISTLINRAGAKSGP